MTGEMHSWKEKVIGVREAHPNARPGEDFSSSKTRYTCKKCGKVVNDYGIMFNATARVLNTPDCKGGATLLPPMEAQL